MSMTSAAEARSHAVSPAEMVFGIRYLPPQSVSDRCARVSGERALRGLRFGRGHMSLSLRIGVRRYARRSSLGHVRETWKEVVPAFGVARDRGLRQPAVNESQTSARSKRREVDLDRARSGRDHLIALPAPGEHDAPAGDDLDVLPGGDVLGARELDAEPATRSRLELGEPALPRDVLHRIGQKAKDRLRCGIDGDYPLNDFRVEGHASLTSSVVPRARRRP